jgi:hypothetical protein
MWVQNALDSPAPLRDAGGRLRWWARDGARRAWGAARWLPPVAAGPGARLPVATRPRRHRDRGAHGAPGTWPQRHPRRGCRACHRPDPVTRDRASRHRHPNARSAPAVGVVLPGPLPCIRTYPASRRAGGLAACRRVVARLLGGPVQGLRIRSARSALTRWRAWEGRRTAADHQPARPQDPAAVPAARRAACSAVTAASAATRAVSALV